MGRIVLLTVTSGIAAANIPSGRTAHSRFKIPIDLDKSLACDVLKQGSLAALIKKTNLIIWDETSMARCENVESLDALLKDSCDSSLLFGGMVIVFGGDFRRILPVVPRKSVSEVIGASLVTSFLWPQLTKFRLLEKIRAREDPEFSEFLLALGNGELQTPDHGSVVLPAILSQRYTEPNMNPADIVTDVAFPEMLREKFSQTFS
ncbi:hypothetical protein vseg_000801 [Gypsophila vaccaria]